MWSIKCTLAKREHFCLMKELIFEISSLSTSHCGSKVEKRTLVDEYFLDVAVMKLLIFDAK